MFACGLQLIVVSTKPNFVIFKNVLFPCQQPILDKVPWPEDEVLSIFVPVPAPAVVREVVILGPLTNRLLIFPEIISKFEMPFAW